MCDEKISICVLTETWLTEQDKHWVETSNLKNANLSMNISNVIQHSSNLRMVFHNK